jgi:hypothetical protein
MRGGKKYAVLKDVDGKVVAAYEVVERLYAVKDEGLIADIGRASEEARAPPRRERTY